MATLSQLIQERSRLRSTPFPATGRATIVQTGENIAGNYWAVQGRFTSLTDKDRSGYSTLLVFHDIEFATEYSRQTPIKVEIFPGEYRYMQIPSFTKSRVRVTCSCADFYWTWWYHVNKKGALASINFPHPSTVTGNDKRADGRPYGSTPGSRNDKRAAGICKHIYTTAMLLAQKKKLVK